MKIKGRKQMETAAGNIVYGFGLFRVARRFSTDSE